MVWSPICPKSCDFSTSSISVLDRQKHKVLAKNLETKRPQKSKLKTKAKRKFRKRKERSLGIPPVGGQLSFPILSRKYLDS
jgi:hypothetical protein